MKSFWLDGMGERQRAMVRRVECCCGAPNERTNARTNRDGGDKGLDADSGCRMASLIANAQLINNAETIFISSPGSHSSHYKYVREGEAEEGPRSNGGTGVV